VNGYVGDESISRSPIDLADHRRSCLIWIIFIYFFWPGGHDYIFGKIVESFSSAKVMNG
jgi:hypothetical protein